MSLATTTDKPQDKSDIIRSLNPGEWYFTVLEHRHLSGGVMVSARYDKPLNKQEVVRALRSVLLDEPWLLVNLFNAGDFKGIAKDVYWKYIDEINLNDVVEFQNVKNSQTDDVQSPFSSSLITDFLYKSPFDLNFGKSDKVLWKLIILNEIEICFIYSHGLQDGESGSIFQRNLFNKLRKFENIPFKDDDTTKIGKKDIPKDIQQINNSDLYLHYKLSTSFLIKLASLPILPNFLKPRHMKYITFPPPLSVEKQSKYNGTLPDVLELGPVKSIFVNLNGIETKNIIKACKKNKTTVTAFLNIASIEVISNFLNKDILMHQVPIDTRKYINKDKIESNSIIGFFTNLVEFYYDKKLTKHQSFWDKVRNNSKQLKQEISTNKVFNNTLASILYSPIFNNPFKLTNSLSISNLLASLSISNLGFEKFIYNKNSKFNIKRMSFSFYCTYGIASVLIDVITTNYNDDEPVMTLYFQTGNNCFKFEELEKITEKIKEKITDLNLLEGDFENSDQEIQEMQLDKTVNNVNSVRVESITS